MEENSQIVSNTKRIDRIEHDLSTLTDKVINLSEIATQTNSNVEHLIEQVRAVGNRTMPKPTNWSVIFAGITLTALIATLALKPLYSSDMEQKQFDLNVMHHLIEDAEFKGRINERTEWLMKLEERVNERLHERL